jgi:Arc/MetJ family transcription regulator
VTLAPCRDCRRALVVETELGSRGEEVASRAGLLLAELGDSTGFVWDFCDQGPYTYGIIVWMKKTLHIDEHLLRDAKSASGAKTDTDTVRLGLEALVRHAAYERLRALRGSETNARDVRRRRERARPVKHSAA